MADNVEANAGSGGATFATDDITGVHYPRSKLSLGADGAATDAVGGAGAVSAAVQRVTLASDDPGVALLTTIDADTSTLAGAVSGAEMQVDVITMPTVTVTGTGGTFPATDSGGSLTVDAPVGTPVFVRLSDGATAISTLPVSLATVPSHAVTNAGTFAVQVDGAALTALQLIDNPVLVDDAAFTPATSSVMMAGFEADEGSTDSVDEGDAGAARMTLDRKVIVNPQPHTAGGLTTARSLDLDETEEDIKTSAGQVYGWNITNFRTTTVYVKFYNATAANVTVGTTTPLFTLAIPGNATDDTMLSMMGSHGIVFDTAITWAATTGLADNDTGAPSANDVAGTVWYK